MNCRAFKLLFVIIFCWLKVEAAKISSIDNAKLFSWYSDDSVKPKIGSFVLIQSQTNLIGVVGYGKIVTFIENSATRSYTVTAEIVKVFENAMIQVGDDVSAVNLAQFDPNFKARNELIVKKDNIDVSSKYKPLYLQGFSIGETSYTLSKNEFLVSMFGHLSYGVRENLSFGLFTPGYLLASPNGNLKWNFWNDSNESLSMGLHATKLRDLSMTAVNLTLYWDSMTSSRMTSHMLATFALATFEKIEDTVAVKSVGTSSFQTGYEYLLSNWDRLLFGPSYNFETKTVGGYLAYKTIWDRFHLSISVSTVNVRDLKFSPTAYVGLIEAYWRF